MATNPLLLHRLPLRAQKRILLNWRGVYLYAFSILSFKSMQLVKSLKLRPRHLAVTVSSSIQLEINDPDGLVIHTFSLSFNYPLNHGHFIMASETPPGPVDAGLWGGGHEHRIRTWIHPNFSIRNWIDHFLSIFELRRITTLVFFPDAERFCLSSLEEAIGGVEMLDVSTRFPSVLEILETFQMTDIIRLHHRFDSMHKVLIQNFQKLIYSTEGDELNLNDLLVCNAKQIRICSSDFSDRDINRFLKLWTLGSNPKLQELKIGLSPTSRDPEVLSGIEARPISMENKRRLPTDFRVAKTEVDVCRKDGTMASLVIVRKPFSWKVKLFVWN